MSGKSNEKVTGNSLDFIGKSVEAIMGNVKLPSTDIGHQYAEIIKKTDVPDDIKRLILKTEYKKYLISTGISFTGFITVAIIIAGTGYKCVKYYCNTEIKAKKILSEQAS